MGKIKLIVILSFSFSLYSTPWATLVAININNQKRIELRNRSSVVFEQALPLQATQLLFSWNALRPQYGYYSFYMQVHDLRMRKWSKWYKIASWGRNIQRSFEHSFYSEPTFSYVRLEMPKGHFANKCKIKVTASKGASLGLLYQLNVAAVNYKRFKSEMRQANSFVFPSLHIRGIPQISQMIIKHPDRKRICSPTAVSMVVSYLKGAPVSVKNAAKQIYDKGLNSYGSWPFNVAYAFDCCKGKKRFAVMRLNSFADLYAYLQKRLPVIVSVRGKMYGMPRGLKYKEGHLMVVVGWDNRRKQVLCHDPAFPTNKLVFHAYPIRSFLAAWERSYRLAYIILP